jgi:ubiquinone/menaquinone biosynthesis C-methylase UbiE
MQSNILHYFSQTNTQYIHAHGEFGTKILTQKLDCQANEKILEIGFGTGATLMYLFSAYPNTNFYGIDQSEFMYKKAQARLNFCRVNQKIALSLMETKNKLPFDSHFFDKIYLESVLAIQEGDDLLLMVQEIRRVLKPEGFLIINETIWLNSTTMAEIRRVNAFGKQHFGIIQCNQSYPYLENWIKLFEEIGFKGESTHKLSEMKSDFAPKSRFSYAFLSSLFSAFGKIKAFFSGSIRKQKRHYAQKMKEVMPDNQPLMEGIIMRFQNQGS